jgi:pyruvate dehydrogenase E1 component alpha subunit
VGGHWASDPGGYRPAEEVTVWRERDPITLLERHLRTAGELDATGAATLWQAARDDVAAAVAIAQAAPPADPNDLGAGDVFAEQVL